MPEEERKPDREANYTGFDIKGNLNAPHSQFAARDFTAYAGPQGMVALDAAFERLFNLIEQAPQPTAVREEAKAKAEALKAEAAKGEAAEDERMATLLDELVALVPGAVQTVVAMFGQPLLAGLVGPVTQFVLNRIRPKQGAK